MSTTLSFPSYASLAKEYGPSFYIIDTNRLRQNYKDFLESFLAHYPSVQVAYSYKTNYIPHLCRTLHSEGAWAEVVSDMEFEAASNLNVPLSNIIFNGPFKAYPAFASAAQGGSTLNLDNHRDLKLLSHVSQSLPDQSRIKVVLRVNFSLGGSISRFGFDVHSHDFQDLVSHLQSHPNYHLAGFHCHFPDRDLNSFRLRATSLLELSKKYFPSFPPDILNIGGGFFSSLSESLKSNLSCRPPSFQEYASVIGQLFSDAYPDPLSQPTLFLEPGTALVADVMTFYTQVISTKAIRNHHFATVAGSIFDISPNAKTRNLPVTPICQPSSFSNTPKSFTIAGFTCIEGDILSDCVVAPLSEGDALAYGNVGSYSVVMRPPFILPSFPILALSPCGLTYDIIKRAQSSTSVFELFS